MVYMHIVYVYMHSIIAKILSVMCKDVWCISRSNISTLLSKSLKFAMWSLNSKAVCVQI